MVYDEDAIVMQAKVGSPGQDTRMFPLSNPVERQQAVDRQDLKDEPSLTDLIPRSASASPHRSHAHMALTS